MTTTQIEAMSDTDFTDCAQTLGGYSTWDSSQLLSLLRVATRSGVGDNTSQRAHSNIMFVVETLKTF